MKQKIYAVEIHYIDPRQKAHNGVYKNSFKYRQPRLVQTRYILENEKRMPKEKIPKKSIRTIRKSTVAKIKNFLFRYSHRGIKPFHKENQHQLTSRDFSGGIGSPKLVLINALLENSTEYFSAEIDIWKGADEWDPMTNFCLRVETCDNWGYAAMIGNVDEITQEIYQVMTNQHSKYWIQ